MKIEIKAFGGIKPRSHRLLGGVSRAVVASNTKLWHGSVAPFREPNFVLDLPECANSIKVVECCVLHDKNPCASFAHVRTPCDRLFATDLCGFDCPMTSLLPACFGGSFQAASPSWTKLGVPLPVAPLTFTVPALTPAVINTVFPDPQPAGVGPDVGRQLKREHRDYVYSYVNIYGEESGISAPSPSAQDADHDAVATLTIPAPPPDSDLWALSKIRIYRLLSGNIDGQYSQAGEYLFVDEIDLNPYPAAPIVYVDSFMACDLGELPFYDCKRTPPCDLKGIISLENGSLAAFSGKDLYFTEPFQYHDWSCHVNLDDCIRGIREVGGQIYVATDGFPYTVSADPPDKDCRCCRTVYKHIEPMPMVSDLRGMVQTVTGAFWPTDDGLVRMSGGNTTLVSHADFAEDDWQEFHPQTFKAVNWNGRYIGFGAKGGLVIDFTDNIYADGDVGAGSRNYTMSYLPNAVTISDAGQLLMVFKDRLAVWNESANNEVYRWRSRAYDTPYMSWNAAKVKFGRGGCRNTPTEQVTLRILAGCGTTLDEIRVWNEKPFRLRAGLKLDEVAIELEGNVEVVSVSIATSIRDLVEASSAAAAENA